MKYFSTRRSKVKMTEDPKAASSSFRNTLRRLAQEDDPVERARVADLFASQIEIALDTQGGNMQVALWNVEESVNQKFDHIHEQIGNSNTLQSAVLQALEGLRTDVQSSATEVATRLGKLADEVGDIGQTLSATISRVDSLEETQQDHGAQLRAVVNRVTDTETRLAVVETEQAVLKAAQAELAREHARLLSHFNRDKAELKRISEDTSGES